MKYKANALVLWPTRIQPLSLSLKYEAGEGMSYPSPPLLVLIPCNSRINAISLRRRGTSLDLRVIKINFEQPCDDFFFIWS